MSGVTRTMCLGSLIFIGAVANAAAQVSPAVQVPLETATGWGPVKTPEGYKVLRIQGTTTADPIVLARLFADFAAHPAMFPRVVDRVEVLACDASALKMRYRTRFDPRPGKRTTVESRSTVNVAVTDDRIEFTWSSDDVESNFVNAVRGRLLVVTKRTPGGTETLVDYVSSVRPRNRAKGLLVESQKSVLTNDARYVIDRLMATAAQRTSNHGNATTSQPLFNCANSQT